MSHKGIYDEVNMHNTPSNKGCRWRVWLKIKEEKKKKGPRRASKGPSPSSQSSARRSGSKAGAGKRLPNDPSPPRSVAPKGGNTRFLPTPVGTGSGFGDPETCS